MCFSVDYSQNIYLSATLHPSVKALLVERQEGHPACKNWVVRYWCDWSEVQMICIWSSWRHCHPTSEWFIFLLLAYQAVLERRPLNGCSLHPSHFFDNPRWQTAIILQIKKLWCTGNSLTNFNELWHSDTHWANRWWRPLKFWILTRGARHILSLLTTKVTFKLTQVIGIHAIWLAITWFPISLLS